MRFWNLDPPVLIRYLNMFLNVLMKENEEGKSGTIYTGWIEEVRAYHQGEKPSLHLSCINSVIEWEGYVYVPEIHFLPEIYFGIWNKPDIKIIPSSVQVYSFSTKGKG